MSLNYPTPREEYKRSQTLQRSESRRHSSCTKIYKIHHLHMQTPQHFHAEKSFFGLGYITHRHNGTHTQPHTHTTHTRRRHTHTFTLHQHAHAGVVAKQAQSDVVSMFKSTDPKSDCCQFDSPHLGRHLRAGHPLQHGTYLAFKTNSM